MSFSVCVAIKIAAFLNVAINIPVLLVQFNGFF